MGDNVTDADALDIVVARTGHMRLREYLDPSHPDHDHRYWRHVRRLAKLYIEGTATTPVSDRDTTRRDLSAAVRARILECPHRTTWSICGCDGWCAIGRGNLTRSGRYYVSWDDCKACLEKTGA